MTPNTNLLNSRDDELMGRYQIQKRAAPDKRHKMKLSKLHNMQAGHPDNMK
jgi:hypothetical protein